MAVPNRQAAASLSPDFPPPHRLVRQNDFQRCPDFASRIAEGEGGCDGLLPANDLVLPHFVRARSRRRMFRTESALQTAYSAAGAQIK